MSMEGSIVHHRYLVSYAYVGPGGEGTTKFKRILTGSAFTFGSWCRWSFSIRTSLSGQGEQAVSRRAWRTAGSSGSTNALTRGCQRTQPKTLLKQVPIVQGHPPHVLKIQASNFSILQWKELDLGSLIRSTFSMSASTAQVSCCTGSNVTPVFI